MVAMSSIWRCLLWCGENNEEISNCFFGKLLNDFDERCRNGTSMSRWDSLVRIQYELSTSRLALWAWSLESQDHKIHPTEKHRRYFAMSGRLEYGQLSWYYCL